MQQKKVYLERAYQEQEGAFKELITQYLAKQ